MAQISSLLYFVILTYWSIYVLHNLTFCPHGLFTSLMWSHNENRLFLEQHQLGFLCFGEQLCSFWGTNWNVMHYLEEFRFLNDWFVQPLYDYWYIVVFDGKSSSIYNLKSSFIFSCVYGSVINNIWFWIKSLNLLTPVTILS